MTSFRLALAAGAALIGGLALGGLYPLALVVAAVLVPAVVLVYLWAVEVYEEEPVRVLALTAVLAAGGGVGFAFLHDAVQEAHAELGSRTTGQAVFWNGVLLPLIGLALVLVGPLVLLPYRRFNDTLDGVTFGAVSAVTFASAALLAHSSSFLASGLEPVGQATPWVVRLLTLGITSPVIAASAVGAAAGAIWLRFRAPARDRRALGAFGKPAPAVAAAAAALVGTSLLELYLGRWAALGALAALAVVSLVALRQVIHVGLIEEAAERIPRPSRPCLDCGRETPWHSYCVNCGTSLGALPKRRTRAVPHGALAGGLAFLVGAALVALLVARPGPIRAQCAGEPHCPGPPLPSSVAAPSPRLVEGRVWRSPLGLQLEYDPQLWTANVSSLGGSGSIFLTSSGPIAGLDVRVFVDAVPAALTSLTRQIDDERSYLTGLYPTLALDRAENQPLTPSIGSAFGIGEADAGTTADEQNPVAAMLVAASRDGIDVLAAAWTDNPRGLTGGAPYSTFLVVDQLLETVRWPSEALR